MYFWRIRELVRILTERDLTESETFRYFFANWVLVTIATSDPSPNWNAWDTTGAIASVVVTVAGLVWCYKNNGGANGSGFLQRMMSILWVMSIRVIAIGLSLLVVAMLVAEGLGVITDETQWWDTLLLFVMEVVIYARTAFHLKTIRVRRQILATDAARATA